MRTSHEIRNNSKKTRCLSLQASLNFSQIVYTDHSHHPAILRIWELDLFAGWVTIRVPHYKHCYLLVANIHIRVTIILHFLLMHLPRIFLCYAMLCYDFLPGKILETNEAHHMHKKNNHITNRKNNTWPTGKRKKLLRCSCVMNAYLTAAGNIVSTLKLPQLNAPIFHAVQIGIMQDSEGQC